MADPRRKTLSYHRAEYLIPNPRTINLGLCIKQATDRLRTVPERSIQRPGGYMMRLAYFVPEGGGYLLHITYETPGEHASIVPTVASDAAELRISTLPPPNNAEFMDGDAFLYVHTNNVCLCTTAVSVGAVRYFLSALFLKARIRADAGDFELMNAFDTRKFALIQAKGIKEIELKASMYKASADYRRRKDHVAGVLGGLSRGVRAILGSPHDVSDDALRVSVTIQLDKRHKHGISLGHKRLELLASDIFQNQEEEDEYTIILESGEKIKPHEAVLRSFVVIDSMGKSVERDSAWGAVLSYYRQLRSLGQLEQ